VESLYSFKFPSFLIKILCTRGDCCTLLLVWFFLLVQGCSVQVADVEKPPQVNSESYSLTGDAPPPPVEAKWWRSLDDENLNILMERALSDNLSLQQGFARLVQVRSLAQQVKSAEMPSVDLNYDGSARKVDGSDKSSRQELAFDLSWEIDLWGRLSNRSEAAGLQTVAAEEDLEDLALLVSFELAKNYYELVEQRLQGRLLERQMEVNSIYLNLVELRFANGAASVVDVYQQRQLLTGKKARMVIVREQIVSLENRLRVLMGKVPGSGTISTTEALPTLPQLPQLGVPADLLQNRPDLRSLNAELQASYYSVAVAVAERLPQLRIGGSAGLVDGDFFYSFFGDAFAAIIDWNKRKSEVERQKAVAWEKASLYAEAYLTAVEEVENSLWREHYHRSLIQTLQQQLDIAKGTLRESRNRYMQGVTDYLPVLAALQTMQELELGYLQRQRELIENRVVLYRALGGSAIDRKEAVSSFLLDKETDRLP
jgi:NodT family efflux transporter outer membrane factor (OMF) lipoprotein